MKLATITPKDQAALLGIHERMGSKYPLPNLDSPLVAIKELCRDDDGDILGGCAVKLIGEAYLWVDPNAPVRQRVMSIAHLTRRATTEAHRLALEDVSAWIPPDIEPQFAHLLTELGWRRSPWPCWSRLL